VGKYAFRPMGDAITWLIGRLASLYEALGNLPGAIGHGFSTVAKGLRMVENISAQIPDQFDKWANSLVSAGNSASSASPFFTDAGMAILDMASGANTGAGALDNLGGSAGGAAKQ